MGDDDDFTADGTVIIFEYGEMSARVITGQNLSPDMIDTILDDARRQVVAGARQLGINPEVAPVADGADEA